MSIYQDYCTDGVFDEMFRSDGAPRAHCRPLHHVLSSLTPEEFPSRCELADRTLVARGITFTVYGDSRGIEKPFPVDLIPRTFTSSEWLQLEAGLKQRVRAPNLFLEDVYNDEKILKDRIVMRDLVVNAAHNRRRSCCRSGGSRRPSRSVAS